MTSAWAKAAAGLLLVTGLIATATIMIKPAASNEPDFLPLSTLNDLYGNSPEARIQALTQIDQQWRDGYVAVLLDIIPLAPEQGFVDYCYSLMARHTGQPPGIGLNGWLRWLWAEQPELHPEYADFKSGLYALIDPTFAGYFNSNRKSSIRLDEVRWGGVAQDGIPPLHKPEMQPASAATYLGDDNIVFGLEINGDARAFPKRILAHHEMATDIIGGEEITLVYCTLCGTVIPYRSTLNGKTYRLGTSGFLYQSNKLMYDKATQSMWNTLWGEPVIGPLVGKGIKLERLSVVTTTWKNWRERHPDTSVLSIQTGFFRNYAEGEAYRRYFATDDLMFPVPQLDNRLANKAEVFTLLDHGGQAKPLAIDTAWLKKHPLHALQLGQQKLVLLTDTSGAIRAYSAGNRQFTQWDGNSIVTDNTGQQWTLSEESLTHSDGTSIPRYPGHRAFWFGWYSAYPSTHLIK